MMCGIAPSSAWLGCTADSPFIRREATAFMPEYRHCPSPKKTASSEPPPLPEALISQEDDPVEPGSVIPENIATGPLLPARQPSVEYLDRRRALVAALKEGQAAWEEQGLSMEEQGLSMEEQKRLRLLLKASMLDKQSPLRDLWDLLPTSNEEL